MALFVVRHQHDAERCPAKDPYMGAMLLSHVSPANAEKAGIRIHGEAVVDGQHTFYLILESPSRSEVEVFMQPFSQAGSVDVWPASSCEKVVERRGCG